MNKWEDEEYRWVYWSDKCRWPEYVQEYPEDFDTNEFIDLFKQRVQWLYRNLDNCESHCRWIIDGSNMIFKFRHETDRLRFILTWS